MRSAVIGYWKDPMASVRRVGGGVGREEGGREGAEGRRQVLEGRGYYKGFF